MAEETDVSRIVTALYKTKGVEGQAEVRKALQNDLGLTRMRISQIMRSDDLSQASIRRIADIFGLTKKEFEAKA